MEKVKKQKLQRGQRILLIFVAAFVLAAVLFAVVLGVIMASRQAAAAVTYQGVTMDKGTALYFASYYKYDYIAALAENGIEAYDDIDFWSSIDENGVAYGSYLVTGARNFISDILVSNYYFDRYLKLTAEEKKMLDDYSETVLGWLTEDALNSMFGSYGITKDTVRRALEMHYKSERAKEGIYGADGVNLMGFPEQCEKYLQEYSRVKLLVINKHKTFVLDENGNRIEDNSGNYKMRDLTAEEKAQRAELIAEIDEAIRGYENNGDIQMREEIFEDYIDRYGEWELDKTESGYYFSLYSQYTEGFADEENGVSKDIVTAALKMGIYEYRKVEIDFAVCYLYRCPVESGAYADSSNADFFDDFYSDAANFLFAKDVSNMREDTVFTGKIKEDDIVGIPYDSDLYIKSF